MRKALAHGLHQHTNSNSFSSAIMRNLLVLVELPASKSLTSQANLCSYNTGSLNVKSKGHFQVGRIKMVWLEQTLKNNLVPTP